MARDTTRQNGDRGRKNWPYSFRQVWSGVLSAGSPSDLNYNYELKAHANLDRLALPLDLLPGRGCLSPAAVLVEFPPSCMHRVCEGEGDEYKI